MIGFKPVVWPEFEVGALSTGLIRAAFSRFESTLRSLSTSLRLISSAAKAVPPADRALLAVVFDIAEEIDVTAADVIGVIMESGFGTLVMEIVTLLSSLKAGDFLFLPSSINFGLKEGSFSAHHPLCCILVNPLSNSEFPLAERMLEIEFIQFPDLDLVGQMSSHLSSMSLQISSFHR